MARNKQWADEMARNKQWAEAWEEHIKGLGGLGWIPNEEDQKRVFEIQKELMEIVERNTEDEK